MNKSREAILLTAEVAATVATVYMVWRVMAGPNAAKTLNLKMTKSAENFCQKQAEGWAHLADSCSKAYNAARNVTV